MKKGKALDVIATLPEKFREMEIEILHPQAIVIKTVTKNGEGGGEEDEDDDEDEEDEK